VGGGGGGGGGLWGERRHRSIGAKTFRRRKNGQSGRNLTIIEGRTCANLGGVAVHKNPSQKEERWIPFLVLGKKKKKCYEEGKKNCYS